MGGSCDVKNAESAAGEFENGGGGVFGFDLMKKRAGASFHANDITEQPEEQVDGVDALIDQSAAAVTDSRGHQAVFEDFLQAIQQNRAPACDGLEGRRSIALVEAIYRAAKTPDRVATV